VAEHGFGRSRLHSYDQSITLLKSKGLFSEDGGMVEEVYKAFWLKSLFTFGFKAFHLLCPEALSLGFFGVIA
jgi:hypothetical protein